MPANACLSHSMLAEFTEGKLPPAERAAVMGHVDVCPACRELLAALGRSRHRDRDTVPADTLAAPRGAGDPDAAPSAFPPKEIGEYHLVRQLGEGGMGQVYLYEDRQLDRPVAIKFLGAGARPELRERFRIEGLASARLSHPNVVTVYRVGEFSGQPFLVTEFVNGRPLSQLDLPLPGAEVLRIAIDLTRGLDAAHQQGVLHRDIKPANVMMTDAGQVKLCDFGLAKLVQMAPPVAPSSPSSPPSQSRAKPGGGTLDGTILGTPAYMSPEAWRGRAATARSDLYSLGVLLHELCCGETLFPGCPTFVALCAAVELRDPPPLRSRAPQIEPRLAALIDRCVRRDPAERFGSAAELLEALLALMPAPHAGGAGVARRLAPVLAGLVAAGAIGAAGRWTYLRAQRRGMAEIPAGTFRMGSSDGEVEAAFRWCQSEEAVECQRETCIGSA